jgi:hypothetical protein
MKRRRVVLIGVFLLPGASPRLYLWRRSALSR